MVLPTNKIVLEEIAEFEGPWTQRFNPSQSVYNLWYSLQVVETLMEQAPSAHGGSDVCMGSTLWKDRFVELDGLRLLKSILMADGFTSSGKLHTHACVSLTLKIISAIISGLCKEEADSAAKASASAQEGAEKSAASDEDKGGSMAHSALGKLCANTDDLSCFVHKLMRIFHTAAMSATTQQGGGMDAVEAHRQSAACYAMRLLDMCARISTQVFLHMYSFPNVRGWVSDVLLGCRSEAIRKV